MDGRQAQAEALEAYVPGNQASDDNGGKRRVRSPMLSPPLARQSSSSLPEAT